MTIEDLALTLTPRLGSKGAVRLLEVFSTAEKIFNASREELMHFAELNGEIADSIVRRVAFGAAEREAKYCARNSISMIASTDPEYPELMRHTPDYPHVLYIKGNPEALHGRNVAVIGTRRISSYGDRMCHDLVRDLGAKLPNLTVVSGLAFGVDSAAHRAALHYNIPTVAVVANPLPAVTPTQHTALAQDIIESGGAIVSECHSNSRQHKNIFIARNRIVAAMSSVTVVVESPLSGGSMATASMAAGYDRLVMAIPGRLTDASSAGCNMLIRNNKAQLYLSADQLIREMMWDSAAVSDRVALTPLAVDLTADQLALLSHFEGHDTISMEELCLATQCSVSQLSVMLMELELNGVVRMLHGNRYELLGAVVAR
ncbi:MAG: DNA-processing protein DprA [Rikenellaceae bacterium]